MIDYDASRDALYRPALRPTVLVAGAAIAADAVYAECSRLAYLHFDSDAAQRQQLIDALARANLSQCEGFSDAKTGTQAYAAINEASGEALIAFRGTEPGDVADLATNINIRPVRWLKGGNAHGGFAAAFESVRAGIQAWIERHAATSALTVTGHSLGAALATLAMSRWEARRLVTFGCPRVGDVEFVASSIDAARCVRYVDCCDIVCRVPPAGPWYCDHGPMRYVDRTGAIHNAISDADVAADRDKARIEYFTRYATGRGNVVVRDLADHSAINYVRALL
jgi:hypothetical protein